MPVKRVIALGILVLLGIWYTHRSPAERRPMHMSLGIPPPNDICTSFGRLTLAAPAHPQVLWLSSRAADYAPDWLRGVGLQLDWALAGPSHTYSTATPIWSTNALADHLAKEAGQFVVALAKLLDRYVRAVNSTANEGHQDQSLLLQIALHQFEDLKPWLKQHNYLPDERKNLRSALAWAYDTDELTRLRNAVHSGIFQLQSKIADGVAHIDREIALQHGPMSTPCLHGMHCLHAWQVDLEHLRQLTAWTDFVEMNVLTSWHIADAMAFFTRYLSTQLDDESNDIAAIEDAYRTKVHSIGHRAGLYAARQWAYRYSNISDEIVKACGSCLTNTSAWHYWWKPYEKPASFNVTEPPVSILRMTRLRGRSEPRTLNEHYPIRAPPDFRKYKAALNGEQCLGIDHLWGEELDRQLLQKAQPSGSPFDVDYYSLRLANEMMRGKTWCIEKARLVENPHLGLLEPTEAYNLRWVKDLKRRLASRNFVHEAWGDL